MIVAISLSVITFILFLFILWMLKNQVSTKEEIKERIREYREKTTKKK